MNAVRASEFYHDAGLHASLACFKDLVFGLPRIRLRISSDTVVSYLNLHNVLLSGCTIHLVTCFSLLCPKGGSLLSWQQASLPTFLGRNPRLSSSY